MKPTKLLMMLLVNILIVTNQEPKNCLTGPKLNLNVVVLMELPTIPNQLQEIQQITVMPAVVLKLATRIMIVLEVLMTKDVLLHFLTL